MTMTKYMTDYERDMLSFAQTINDVKVRIHNAEKRLDQLKEEMNLLQERKFDLEEKYARAGV